VIEIGRNPIARIPLIKTMAQLQAVLLLVMAGCVLPAAGRHVPGARAKSRDARSDGSQQAQQQKTAQKEPVGFDNDTFSAYKVYLDLSNPTELEILDNAGSAACTIRPEQTAVTKLAPAEMVATIEALVKEAVGSPFSTPTIQEKFSENVTLALLCPFQTENV